jgi:hypothetical protein
MEPRAPAMTLAQTARRDMNNSDSGRNEALARARVGKED